MNKYHWLAVALVLGMMTGLTPAVTAETIPEDRSAADLSYLLTPYSDSVPAEWLVFNGAARSVYFERVIEAAQMRNDVEGVARLKQLAAAPPAIPTALTPEMNRYYPSFAAIYASLREREKNAMTYRDYASTDQWRVDQTEADLALVAWELQKGRSASTSFMDKYLHDAAWALNHHIEVHPRAATPAPAVVATTPAVVAPAPAAILPPLTSFRIHFNFDEEAIRADAVDTMRQVAALLRQNPDLRMSLNGHTDAKGSDGYNMALGERRAKSVRDYFLAHFGLSPLRFALKSRGEAEPIAPNTTRTGQDNPEGRALNRRAEFIEIR